MGFQSTCRLLSGSQQDAAEKKAKIRLLARGSVLTLCTFIGPTGLEANAATCPQPEFPPVVSAIH